MQTIKMYHAFNGFLYAPVFLADRLGYFPKNMQLQYVPEGDHATIEMLCQRSGPNEKNWFAICDPLAVDLNQIVTQHTKDSVCVVGTMIDKLPMWVYNCDPKIVPVENEGDLARFNGRSAGTPGIDKLICYPIGTTGHLIAKRLQGILGLKDTDLIYRDFGTEFDTAINHREAAATNDVLRVVHGKLNNKNVIFNYTTRSPQELDPFLFTAILTLDNEVLDKNLWAVLSLLSGVKRGIDILTSETIEEDHIQILVEQFDDQLRKMNVTRLTDKRALVRETIDYLRDQGVYANDMGPTEKSWLNAKKQWEQLLHSSRPDMEQRRKPIPSLLIRNGWAKNPKLREQLAGTKLSITDKVFFESLKWYHKLSIAGCLIFGLIFTWIFVDRFAEHIQKGFEPKHWGGTLVSALSIIGLFVIAYLIDRDLFGKFSTVKFGTYVGTALGLISVAVSVLLISV